MTAPPIPTKTALGQEALRRRTGELGQRHRTILFLVDGRRPLSEVLSLAHQAGAATSHFEDLVRMGYVELPPEEPPAAPPPPDAPLEAAMPPEITELAVEVTAEAEPEAVDAPLDEAPPVPPPPPLTPPRAVLPAAAPAPPPPEPALAHELPKRPFLPPTRVVPPPASPAPPVVVLADDMPVLEQARAQLLECLRCDPQPAGARLADRVRAAKGSSELIDVVWTMERGLHHHRRSHRGLIALQRARELLGLGNTLVDEDSRPGRLDDDW